MSSSVFRIQCAPWEQNQIDTKSSHSGETISLQIPLHINAIVHLPETHCEGMGSSWSCLLLSLGL